MKAIKITIIVTDPEALEDYKDTPEELVAEMFLNNMSVWIKNYIGTRIEVAKE